MKVAYTPAQKAEAVALATVIGADAASAQLGMGAKAIRGWAERAGKSPSDVIETDQWRALMDVALARVTAQVASGTMRVRDIAVVAGIAARNVREPAIRPARATDAETAVDVLEAELSVVYGEDWPTAATVLIRGAEQAFEDPLGYLAALVSEHGSLQAVRDWQRAEPTASGGPWSSPTDRRSRPPASPSNGSETEALIAEAEQLLHDQKETP